MSSGTEANDSGNVLEAVVKRILDHYGLHCDPQKRNVGVSVLGKNMRCDVLVMNAKEFPDGLIVECRWQESSGSADEKIVYMKENIFNAHQYPVIAVIDGRATKHQIEYLRQFVDGKKLIGVYRLAQFMAYCKHIGNGKAKRIARKTFDSSQRKLFTT